IRRHLKTLFFEAEFFFFYLALEFVWEEIKILIQLIKGLHLICQLDFHTVTSPVNFGNDGAVYLVVLFEIDEVDDFSNQTKRTHYLNFFLAECYEVSYVGEGYIYIFLEYSLRF